jgi:hypothetical protein
MKTGLSSKATAHKIKLKHYCESQLLFASPFPWRESEVLYLKLVNNISKIKRENLII